MSVLPKSCILVLGSVLLRWCVSMNGYSGKGKPPMYGDYEAQRHWMEITLNLPIVDWYKNTTDNDLLYWGLDYPPLTAYHSYICGYLARFINPDWVALNSSRGFESYQHKLFMRYNVLVSDLLVLIPSVFAYFFSQWKLQQNEKLSGILVMLMYPGLILIDHGHFQFNGISLGFALLAMTALAKDYDLIGAMMFCLALNYKQMELYHAIPFFCYLLGSCFQVRAFKGYVKFLMLALVVLITFGLCWLPFLQDVYTALSVLKRLFPFGRGVYEDKVANVWCSLSVLIKIKQIMSSEKLVLLCLGSTFAMLVPSSLHLLLKPSFQNFKLALINSSLVFFLFSFQVHEKSILLAAIPVAAVAPVYPLASLWFLVISVFSMLPLLNKDGLLLSSVVLSVLFTTVAMTTLQPFEKKKIQGFGQTALKILFRLSILGAITLTVMSQVIPPPAHLPDLFPVLISAYSCGHFILFLLFFSYQQVCQKRIGFTSPVYSEKLHFKKIK